MKHTFETVALGVLLVVLSACGGGGGNSSTAPVNMAGNWQFTGNSTTFGYTFTATGPVNQTKSSISGTLSLSGSPCAQTAEFSGSLSGTSLSVTAKRKRPKRFIHWNGLSRWEFLKWNVCRAIWRLHEWSWPPGWACRSSAPASPRTT